jgi:hypothetical protein
MDFQTGRGCFADGKKGDRVAGIAAIEDVITLAVLRGATGEWDGGIVTTHNG